MYLLDINSKYLEKSNWVFPDLFEDLAQTVVLSFAYKNLRSTSDAEQFWEVNWRNNSGNHLILEEAWDDLSIGHVAKGNKKRRCFRIIPSVEK